MCGLNFKVDSEKCIHCGLCVKDCIAGIIKFDENKNPKVEDDKHCIGCQHCLAICPVGAISVFDKNPENSDKIYSQNPDMILNLIKSRRSDRNFLNRNVDKEKLNKLKEMLSYVPTGCNQHKLKFSFVEDVEVMNEVRNFVNQKIINALTKAPIKAVAEKFSPYTKAFLNGDDVIFRNAPHMLVVSNSVTATCCSEDVIIALSYFELYAQSLGLGTCWCGFGEMCLKLFPELCDYFQIPDGYGAGYVILFGEKSVNYSRTTQPLNADIVTIDNKEISKISVAQTAKRHFWNFLR